MTKVFPALYILIAILFVLPEFIVAEPELQLQLGSSEADPGNEADIPLEIATTGEIGAGELQLNLCLPEELVTFVSLQPGPALEAVQGKVSSAAIQGSSPDCSGQAVKISFSKLPAAGTLATLRVKIKVDAPLDEQLELRLADAVLARGDQSIPAVVKLANGSLLVGAAPAIFGCFFYMH